MTQQYRQQQPFQNEAPLTMSILPQVKSLKQGEVNEAGAKPETSCESKFKADLAAVPVSQRRHEVAQVLQQKGAVAISNPSPQQPQHPNTKSPSTSNAERAVQGKANLVRQRQDPSVVQRPNQTGLPDGLKSGIESLSGLSLENVKVHYNSSQPAQLNAFAYTQDSDIYVAPGQEQHLPHEAWHIVQQQEGRVKPTLQMKGVMINDDLALETEADQMGSKALSAGNSGNRQMPVLRKTWSATHFPAQLITIYRGMKASAPGGNLPKQKDAVQHLGVRDHDVKGHIEEGKVVHHGGMSTSMGQEGGPPRTLSKLYKSGADDVVDQGHANFLWNWSFNTATLPATLQAYNDHDDHVLVEPAISGDLTLAEFRAAVHGTQANWVRIDPPAPAVAAPAVAAPAVAAPAVAAPAVAAPVAKRSWADIVRG